MKIHSDNDIDSLKSFIESNKDFILNCIDSLQYMGFDLDTSVEVMTMRYPQIESKESLKQEIINMLQKVQQEVNLDLING